MQLPLAKLYASHPRLRGRGAESVYYTLFLEKFHKSFNFSKGLNKILLILLEMI